MPSAIVDTVHRVPKQKRARETRQKILDATLELLEEAGIEKVSTNAIARRAGVNIASLYKYFPDKYEILKILALQFGQKQSQLICDYLARADPGTDLETVCHGIVDVMIDGTRGDLALVQLQRSLIVIPELLDAYRMTNLDIAEAMKPFFASWGIALTKEQLALSMTCIGEASSALQDLALSRNPQYDEAVIRELKLLITSYYRALTQR